MKVSPHTRDFSRVSVHDEMYETCKDCPYYYGEINWCMYGEEDVSDDLEKKCDKEK